MILCMLFKRFYLQIINEVNISYSLVNDLNAIHLRIRMLPSNSQIKPTPSICMGVSAEFTN